ncbi:956_t:CDS:2 [Ambispora gerdemannii]|uniref:956_t:CDS:1 n=1 Tax=Ambispora gerdemannii TaxID=144530 RepID=A0A9N9DYR7_9GLOM|nr:956_t:CDS:2 [Ambispora gerdemannii]
MNSSENSDSELFADSESEALTTSSSSLTDTSPTSHSCHSPKDIHYTSSSSSSNIPRNSSNNSSKNNNNNMSSSQNSRYGSRPKGSNIDLKGFLNLSKKEYFKLRKVAQDAMKSRFNFDMTFSQQDPEKKMAVFEAIYLEYSHYRSCVNNWIAREVSRSVFFAHQQVIRNRNKAFSQLLLEDNDTRDSYSLNKRPHQIYTDTSDEDPTSQSSQSTPYKSKKNKSSHKTTKSTQFNSQASSTYTSQTPTSNLNHNQQTLLDRIPEPGTIVEGIDSNGDEYSECIMNQEIRVITRSIVLRINKRTGEQQQFERESEQIMTKS